MQATDFEYTFESVVSFDDGETTVPVTVAYDYTPEELNYPYEPDYAESFEVFVFDASGKDITSDISEEETDRLNEEAKEDLAQIVADFTAI